MDLVVPVFKSSFLGALILISVTESVTVSGFAFSEYRLDKVPIYINKYLLLNKYIIFFKRK